MLTEGVSNTKMLTKLMFRLLPVQILLAAVGAVNGIVSTYFATNYVGIDAMSAVGLFGPISMLLSALNIVLFGGAVILCGKYLGQNKQDSLRACFTINMVFALILSFIFIALMVLMSVFDLTGIFTSDQNIRPLFNRYLLGQAIGILPFFIGSQLPAFLSLENKSNRTIVATVAYIVINLILNYVFVKVLKMEAFGLALATALGMWVFMGVQVTHFISGKSHFRFSPHSIVWKEGINMIRVGYPGALSNGYQTIRGFIVNALLTAFVGSAGLSAFASSNNLLGIFWAVPCGMLAVSRMIISISIGEEDRQTLTDCFRVMLKKYLPLVTSLALVLCLLAEPLTRIFYKDPTQDVYSMTVWGVRLLPWAMPLGMIATHFVCYWQASGRQVIVHILSIVDGFVGVCACAAATIYFWGMNSVYIANIFNGVLIVMIIIIHSVVINKRMSLRIEDQLCIPEGFGVPQQDRLDITVKDIREVVNISGAVQSFCDSKGIEHRRAMIAGLAMEEMAGNIVEHGFTKDNKEHTIDVRVVYKNGAVILRLKDDCVAFDPATRQKMAENDDVTKNVGIRMIFKMADNVDYQSLLGNNVLTIRV